MTLIEKQFVFARLYASLVTFAFREGHTVTHGETWRPNETAYLYAKQGRGSAKSLHCLRLAGDLNLIRDGKLVEDSEDYRPLGEYWESLSTPEYNCVWGGRFKKPDGNHFSIEHGGVK